MNGKSNQVIAGDGAPRDIVSHQIEVDKMDVDSVRLKGSNSDSSNQQSWRVSDVKYF